MRQGRGRSRRTVAWRALAAVVVSILAVVTLTGAVRAVRWYRATNAKASRAGDACRLSANGGIVGLDATTGAIRWTNIVPPGSELAPDASGGRSLHSRTISSQRAVDRTVASDGSVVSCRRITDIDPATGPDRPDELSPGAKVDGLTIVPWGSGLRATDATGKGIWGTTDMTPIALRGDALLVQTQRFGDAQRRTVALVDLRTGAIRWEQPGLAVNAERARDLVLVRSAGQRRRYQALDADTGVRRWQTTIPAPDDDVSPHAWEAGGLVVFGLGDDGRVAAVDAATGRNRWTATAGTPGRSRWFPEPGTAHDVAIAADGRTIVVAVDAVAPEVD